MIQNSAGAAARPAEPMSVSGPRTSSRVRRVRSGAIAIIATSLFGLSAHSPASAGTEALHLTWNDCWNGAGAASTASFSCQSNSDQRLLVAAFAVADPIDSVIAAEVVIDIQLESAGLSPWWEFQVGGCREGSLVASASTAGLSCTPTWGTSGFGLVQDYTVGAPRGGANQARIRAVVAVPSDSARTFTDSGVYLAVALVLDAARSAGPGLCAGCDVGACLVLNSVLLRRLPGGTGDRYLQIPAAGNGNWVTWASGGTAACAPVPARAVTWGQVKSLYR